MEKTYIVDGKRVSHDEYTKTRYEDLRIRVPKGKKAIIQAHAETQGESLNAYVCGAVDARMEKEDKKEAGAEPRHIAPYIRG